MLFRTVNEEIEKLGRADAHADARLVGFVCECSDETCAQQIQLTSDEYEKVRSDGRRFAVAPGHVTEAVEHVVETADRFVVVEKDTPVAAKIAEDADPRD